MASEWKRPSDIMKIQRRRKSVSQKRIPSDHENRTTVIYKSPSKPVKRRNPFSVSDTAVNPSKRQNVGQSENGEKDCLLFDVLSMTETQRISRQQKSCISVEVEQGLQSQTVQNHLKPSTADIPQNKQILASTIVDNPKQEELPYVPIDWSLKTKMRIVSNQSLQWCTQLKSTDEAQGISNFVTNQHMKVDNLNDQKKSFQRCCMYWEHPNIPWVRLFPRIIDDSKLSGSGTYLMQDDVQKALQADWEQSFTSVYHQLRSRLCPYFYLCTHLFTVMFQYHSGPQSDMFAMVTPTTRGFREALENEGIPFKLPVLNKIASPDKTLINSKENEEPEENAEQNESKKVGDVEEEDDNDLLETDDAASGWLESIGLDKKSFPSLDPRKVKIQREGFRVIDNRPESLVLVQGPDVQALFNFLLNCRTCTANSGPQAGIPPTILSASPFKGATLKCQKVKHSSIKHSDKEGHISHAHILEVTGPILTSHSQAVTTLLHHTQTADFSIVYSNHDATTPFNILPKVLKEHCVRCGSTSCHGNETCEINENSDRDSNILNLSKFYKNTQISDRLCAIKEVSCTPDGFTWNTQ